MFESLHQELRDARSRKRQVARLCPVSARQNERRVSQYRVNALRLEGQVCVSCAKNSVLRLLAASSFTSGKIKISNDLAMLLDAQVHLGMLEVLGKRCVVCIEKIAPHHQNWKGHSIRNTLFTLFCSLVGRGCSLRLPAVLNVFSKSWTPARRADEAA